MTTTRETTDSTDQRKTAILLLRDPTVRKLVVVSLSLEGWSTRTAESLAEARPPIAAGGVLLADWQRLDGLLAEERRAELRALGRTVALVVLVPAFWRRYLSAEDLGVAGLLSKPFELAELLQALNRAAAWSPAEEPEYIAAA